jgi:hypothetical protein
MSARQDMAKRMRERARKRVSESERERERARARENERERERLTSMPVRHDIAKRMGIGRMAKA